MKGITYVCFFVCGEAACLDGELDLASLDAIPAGSRA